MVKTTAEVLIRYSPYFIAFGVVLFAFQIIAYVEGDIVLYFNARNLQIEGAYVFLVINIVVNILAIMYIINKSNKRNWLTIKTNFISYSIEKFVLNFDNIYFTIDYHPLNNNFQKKFSIIQRQSYRPNTEKVLRINLDQQKNEAIVYCDPKSENNFSYQVGFTIFDILAGLLLVYFQLILVLNSIFLIILKNNLIIDPISIYGQAIFEQGYQMKTFEYLAQNPIGYILLLDILITIMYYGELIFGIKKIGFIRYRRYPMFYNPVSKQKFDLIKEFKLITIYCQNCGQLLNQNTTFCPNCRYLQQRN